MPLLMLRDLPRYECLQEAASECPGMDVSACEVFLNILRTGDAVSGSEAAFLAGHGLSQGRLIVLKLLAEAPEGSLRSSELADHAAVCRATMTGLLDALERDGWVERATDPNDRRALRVKITESGAALLKRAMPSYFAWISKSLEVLTPKERDQFVQLLRKTQQVFMDPARNGECV